MVLFLYDTTQQDLALFRPVVQTSVYKRRHKLRNEICISITE